MRKFFPVLLSLDEFYKEKFVNIIAADLLISESWHLSIPFPIDWYGEGDTFISYVQFLPFPPICFFLSGREKISPASASQAMIARNR